MKRLFHTTLRLNLEDEEDRKAYEYLRTMDKKRYHSYSKAIATAINDSFGRQQRLAADPYLETREKEDAFLARIAQTIESRLQAAPSSLSAMLQLVQGQPLAQQAMVDSETNDEDISAALDFIDSF